MIDPKTPQTLYAGINPDYGEYNPWSLVGSVWKYNDYTYKTCNGCGSILAAITSPVPGSTLAATTVTFT